MNDVVISVTQIVRTVEVNATPNLITITVNSSSGGSGAVSSVFGRSGAVSAQNGDYAANQITETTSRVFVSPAEKAEIPHGNRSVLDLISAAFTTTLKNLYDAAATAIASHITDTANPHNTTASQVGAYTTAQVDALIPNLNGGTAGQLLAKNSATDKDWSWIDNYTEDVRNTVKASEIITKGQAVYISGANGTNQLIAKADYSAEATSSQTIGIAYQNFANNAIGQVITYGLLSGINTNSAEAGDPVYLGANGALIFGLANKPVAPKHLVYIGVVTRKSATVGEIFVKIQNGYELGELHDVNTALSKATPVDADALLLQDSENASLWKRLTLSNLYSYIKAKTDSLYVPTTRTVNSKALSTNVTLSASDVGAPAGSGTSTGTNTGDQDLSGLVPTTRMVNGKALSANITLSASDVGAPAGSGTSTGTNTGDQDLSGLVPTTRTVNSKALSANITLSASDVGAPAGSGTSTGANTGDETATSIGTKIGFLPFKFVQTSQTPHTGTLSETAIAVATINGGRFNASDLMEVLFKLTKGATTSAVTARIRINTTNTLSGAVQVAIYSTFTTANTYMKMKRSFDLSGGNLYGYNFSSSIIDDATATNTVGSNTPYNTATTLYVLFTVQLGTVGDSVTPNLVTITN